MKQRFFICDRCGHIVAFVKESGVDVVCCEEFMKELVPRTVDVSSEKHAPVYTVENGVVEVSVGALPHPMSEEHHIEWISLRSKFGNQRKELCPTGEPAVGFALSGGDEVREVYAYCNLHGLWQSDDR